MKAATVKELKEELKQHSSKDLLEICLRLSKFKKENKELLTYLLFEASNEQSYIESVKEEVNAQFDNMNRKSAYIIKKGIRKILSSLKKYIRYSQKKETEVELLIFFCKKLVEFKPSIKRSLVLMGIYNRQIDSIHKVIKTLHEDLQYDYQIDLEELE